jgi:class 3 adenylate cyclase
MVVERVFLLIADIGGYTRFMSTHRVSLGHAQEIIGILLEVVMDAASMFKVSKIEGDAVFMYRRLPPSETPDVAAYAQQVQQIRRAFLARQQFMAANRLCNCDSCVQVSELRLKFVSHLGEAAFHRIGRFEELAGVDVILVHRLLKNSVPVSEYFLMTESILEHLSPDLKELALPRDEALEGLGTVRTHYLDLSTEASQVPPVRPAWNQKLWQWLKISSRAVPVMVGLKKPCLGFQHIGPDGPITG